MQRNYARIYTILYEFLFLSYNSFFKNFIFY